MYHTECGPSYPRRIFYRGKARRLLIDLRGVDRTFPEVND